MVTAAIKINGVPGSNDGLSVGVTANLSDGGAGATSWSWQFVSRPPGSSATILTPTASTASFIPDVVGSYLIRLTVIGGSSSATDEVIGAVLTPNLSMRIPAVREESEFDAEQGWAEAIHTAMIALDTASGGTHGIGSATHTPSTLAQLNTKISDANLDDSSGTRPPTTHGLSSVYHSNTTLAALNLKISDANLDDSGDSRTPSGAAAGDLSGTYPSPDVVKIRGQSVSANAPNPNDVLVFTAGVWTPTAVALTGNTLNGAYDEGGAGAGRTITADSGAVFIDASGDSALELDGYLNLREISDPAAESERGFVYVKDDGGDTELFYMDDSGNAVQLTKDGAVDVSLAANTLDQAYDQGGAGAGRVIIADSGSVLITVGANNHGLEVDGTGVAGYTSNSIYVNGKGGAADVEGILVNFDADGFDNGRAIQGVVDSGALSYGDEVAAISGVVDGSSASAGSEVIALRGEISGSSSSRQIGAKLAGSDWDVAVYAESGQIYLHDGYVALKEISDPTAATNIGMIYTKDDSGDTELYYRDAGGNVVKITEDGVVNASGAGNKLGQAYNQGGPGAGRIIDAYDGPVYFNYDGYEVARINGVMGFDAQTLVPIQRAGAGYLYSAVVDGYVELFYRDNYGSPTQITSDGYLDTFESLRGIGLYAKNYNPSLNSEKGYIYTKQVDGYVELYYSDGYSGYFPLTSRGQAAGGGGGGTASNLQQAYDGGKTITTIPNYPVHIISSDAYDSYESIRLDGYLGFDSVPDHPSGAIDRGFIYVKDDSGDIELFYMDDSARIVQITKDGYVAGASRPVPDSKLPWLYWGGVSQIEVKAAPGQSSVVKITLQDEKERSFNGTLSFDPSLGVADGGLDTGSESALTWYYLYLVPKSGDDDFLTVRGSENPPYTGPAGYSNYRYIGAVRNHSSDLAKFYQIDDNNFSRAIHANIESDSGPFDDGSPVAVNVGPYVPDSASAIYLAAKCWQNSGLTVVTFYADGDEGGSSLYRFWISDDDVCVVPPPIPMPTDNRQIWRKRDNQSGQSRYWELDTTGWLDGYLGQAPDAGNAHYGAQNLDQAYDGGRAITIDSGPIQLNASGEEAINVDGYLGLAEISDPTAIAGKGLIYTSDDSGDTELFYKDDSGNAVQITKDGAVNASGGGGISYSDIDGYATKDLLDGYATKDLLDGYATFVDGYLKLPEREHDPIPVEYDGYLYTKNDDAYGTAELFYMDDYGQVTQITQNGAVNASGGGGGGGITTDIATVLHQNTDSSSDVVVGAFTFNKSDYSGASTIKFKATGYVTGGSLTGTLTMYNVTDTSTVATLTFTSVTIGEQISADIKGSLPSSDKVYEFRLKVTGGSPPSDLVLIEWAGLEIR